VTREPGQTLRIDGHLTLHGLTKPLTLHARLNKEAPNPFDKRPTLGQRHGLAEAQRLWHCNLYSGHW